MDVKHLFTIMHCEPVMRYIMWNAETIARHAAAKNPLASGDVLETREPPASGPASGCNGSGGVGGAVQLHRFISFTFPGRIKPPPRPLSVMKRVGYRETEEAAWFEYTSLSITLRLSVRASFSPSRTRVRPSTNYCQRDVFVCRPPTEKNGERTRGPLRAINYKPPPRPAPLPSHSSAIIAHGTPI